MYWLYVISSVLDLLRPIISLAFICTYFIIGFDKNRDTKKTIKIRIGLMLALCIIHVLQAYMCYYDKGLVLYHCIFGMLWIYCLWNEYSEMQKKYGRSNNEKSEDEEGEQ